MIVRVLLSGTIGTACPVSIFDARAVKLLDEYVELLGVSGPRSRVGSSLRVRVKRSARVFLQALVLLEFLGLQLEANAAFGLQRATVEDHGRRALRVLRRLIELAGVDQMPVGSPSRAIPSQRHPDWYATTNYNICSATLLMLLLPTLSQDQPSPSDKDQAGTLADGWLSTKEAAELTGLHPETIRRWIRNGAIEARRTGGPGRQQEVRRIDLIAHASPQNPARPRAERSQILLPGDRTVLTDS